MAQSELSMNSLAISDFEKQPRRAYLFDRWAAERQIPTPLGPFEIHLHMMDTNPPDEEMIVRASELIRFVEAHGEELMDIVYGHYLLSAEAPGWLELCGVPRNLGRAEVPAFLGYRMLVVSRHLNWKEQYASVVGLDTLWDTEHSLGLEIRDGEIATANGAMFKLEAQVLRWVRNSTKKPA